VVISTTATMVIGADEISQSMPFVVTMDVLIFLSLFVYIYLAYKQVSKPYQHAVWLLLFIGLLSI
jgi:fructose-specific phosphotransferase system IIC component